MLIKILLVGGGVVLLFYFLVAARNRPVQKLAMSLVFLLIIGFALSPQLADRVAAAFGVGRGVDLALYLSTLALLFICFNLYLRQKTMEDRFTLLVRQLALLTARPAPLAELNEPTASLPPVAQRSSELLGPKGEGGGEERGG